MRALPPSIVCLVLLLTGCPGGSEDPTPTPTTAPVITIQSPAMGSPVTTGADSDRSVQVEFTVEGLNLAAPGTCLAADAPCGHIRVQVDGGACAGDAPFNAIAVRSPARAALATCANPEGSHTISLTPVNDRGEPFLTEGEPVSAEVTLTVALPSLYERLGGEAGLAALSAAMMTRQLAAPEINAYFRNASVDHARMEQCMTVMFRSMLGEAAGGAECELDMQVVHAGLGISMNDFDDWLAQFDGAAAQLGMGAADAAELRGMLQAMNPSIVEDPTSDATLYQRLGRRPGLEAAVGVFVNHLLGDPLVARYFLDAAGLPDYSPTFSTCLVRLLGSLDGPFIYGEGYPFERWLDEAGRPCRSMADSHEDVTSAPPEETPIRGEEFLQVAGILVDTLVYLEVPQSEIDLLVGAMNIPFLCTQILADPTECDALFPPAGP